ncbi:MAG TPA: hypothetical protein VL201_01680, partial [Patescibacteria group bacterium]|nr:hypothetical protein [Patescibacteria group bacterium]
CLEFLDKKNVDLPLFSEKITCFFSDIPVGKKDKVQFSITEIANVYLEKYTQKSQQEHINHYEEIEKTYKTLPQSIKKQSPNCFTRLISKLAMQIDQHLSIDKKDEEQDAALIKLKKEYEDTLCFVEATAFINLSAQYFLKNEYKSSTSFKMFYNQLVSKEKNRNIKLKKQRTLLLKLITTKILTHHLNTDIHRNILLYALQDQRDKLYEIVSSVHTTFYQDDWPHIYSNIWPEHNPTQLMIRYFIDILINPCRKFLFFYLSYLPVIDHTLTLDFSDNTLSHYYYEKLKKIPPILLNKITAIKFLINDRTFSRACKFLDTLSSNLPIEFNFLHCNFIQADTLILPNDNCVYYLNDLYKKHFSIYTSIMKNIKIVTIKSGYPVTSNGEPHPNFFENLPKTIVMQFDLLRNFLKDGTLTIDESFSGVNRYSLKLLNKWFLDKPCDHFLFKNISNIRLDINPAHTGHFDYDNIFFMITFLKKRAKQPNELPMNNNLLPLLTCKNEEKFKPIFEDITTIVSPAATIVEFKDIINTWNSIINAKNFFNPSQLKIVAPSETLQKNFERSFYSTLFNDAIVKSFLNSTMKKESYPVSKNMDLIYKWCHYLFVYIYITYNRQTLTTLDMVQLIFGVLSSILPIKDFLNNKTPDSHKSDITIWLINKFLQYIFIGASMYRIVFESQYLSWQSLLLKGGLFLVLMDYYHVNRSSLSLNLIHAFVQSIKNRSFRSPNITIEIEQTKNNLVV